MPDDRSFWKTIPGILTTVTAVVSALTGLIVAVNETGVFKSQEVQSQQVESQPAPAARAETANVSGAWRAQVTYSWGATHPERFVFQTDGNRLAGTVTYLGVARGVEAGTIDGNDITFAVSAEEMLGSDRRQYQLSYRGTVVGGGLHFVLSDSRGTPSVQFAAARDLPSP